MLGITSGARAGPLEELDQLAVAGGALERMAMRYVYGGDGLVVSDDHGVHWRALCADGIRAGGTMPPPVKLGRIAIDGDGTLYLSTFAGLLHDDGRGCNWQSEPLFANRWVTDVVAHPTDPDVLFALTSDASPDAKNGVFRRDADGTWHALGTQDALLLGRLHVVERGAGKLRMVQRGVRGMYGTAPNFRPNFVVRVSDDMGKTWTEHEFGETEGTPDVEAVDPTDPDRIVASLRFDRPEFGGEKEQDQVLVSEDAGRTFAEYLRVTAFGGIDFAPDGRVWIGDRGDTFGTQAPSGLFFAASLAQKPTKLTGTLQLRCVDHRSDSDDLFVCQPYEAGQLGANGKGYARAFSFRTVPEFVACEGVDFASVCSMAFLGAWCGVSHFPEAPLCCVYPNRQGVSTAEPGDAGSGTVVVDCSADAGETDAGTPHRRDAAAADGGVGPARRASDCGCRSATPSGGRVEAAWGALLALVASVRLRRRHRSR